MSYFIRHFKINEMVKLHNQFAFAVIEGEPVLIGPFKPKKVDQTGKHPEIHHTEHQCIPLIYEYVKKNKSMIKDTYMFTKNSPCLGRNGKCDPCMIELARFSEEMYNEYNIDLFTSPFRTFMVRQGIYFKKLKDSSSYKDPLIRKIVLELKEMFNKKLRISEFTGKIIMCNISWLINKKRKITYFYFLNIFIQGQCTTKVLCQS